MNFQSRTLMQKFVPFILSACLMIGFSFLATEEAFSQTTPDKTSAAVTGLTAGRVKAVVGGVIALISLIMGWRALAHSGSTKRTQAIIALSLGMIAIILSVAHLSTSAGAVFGSGSGKAGAIVSLVLALTGTALSGLALRPKRQDAA
ncbi:MAG TPA: DUF6223 family protein [Chitinophaga sp.]